MLGMPMKKKNKK